MPFKSKVDWPSEIKTIKELGSQGVTGRQLAKKYGVSSQRMSQILKRYVKDWKDLYGRAVTRSIKAEEYRRKHGIKENSELYRMQKHRFSRKRANATRVGHEWSVEFGELAWPTHCPILGLELDYFLEYRAENSPSFDQIEAGKGYVSGNVQIVSWRANRIKNDGTAEEHRKIAEWMESH